MAAHVRNDRDVLSALEWLGQTDPGQISAVSRDLPAQMRSSLIASIGACFAAADEPHSQMQRSSGILGALRGTRYQEQELEHARHGAAHK